MTRVTSIASTITRGTVPVGNGMTIPTNANDARHPPIAAALLLFLAIARPVTAQVIHDPGFPTPIHGWHGHSWIDSTSRLPPIQPPYDEGVDLPANVSQGYPSFNSASPPQPALTTSGQGFNWPNYEWQNHSPFSSVSLLQPAPGSSTAAQPSSTTTQPAASSSSSSSNAASTSTRSRSRVSDASGNKQQTDSFTSSDFSFWSSSCGIDGVVEFPVPGRTKVAENNSAMPENRVYFVYKHFHNTLDTTIDDSAGTIVAMRNYSINRYVLGMEKVFCDGMWSVEMRLPVTTTLGDAFDQGLTTNLGGIGNPSITLKRLLYGSDTLAVAAGFAVSLPTGQDARFGLRNELFTLHNQSAHLLPFAMFVSAPTRLTFYRGSLQLDIPALGNRFDVRDLSVGAAVTDLGTYRDQSLLYAGLSTGVWLYQNPESRGLTSVASAVDLQYTGTVAAARQDLGSTTTTKFLLDANNISVLNLGFGLYSHFGNGLTTYAGTVFPLDAGVNRFFDAEVQFSANYAF